MEKFGTWLLNGIFFLVVGALLQHFYGESPVAPKTEVRIDTVYRNTPPITKWLRGSTVTDTVAVEDTAKTNYYRHYADSISKNFDVLVAKMMPKFWYVEDSIQKSKHTFFPDSDRHVDSIGYKPRKEMIIRRDSIIYVQPSFWDDLKKYGLGFAIGYLTSSAAK